MSEAEFAAKRVLVTGGAGFIGSNFVRYVLEHTRAERVVNLDCLTYAGNLENLAEVAGDGRYGFVRADVRDFEALARAIEAEDVDCVVHFAAESHVDRSIVGPAVFVQTNVSGTLNVLHAVKQRIEKTGRAIRVLNVGTDEVYGSLGPTGAFREEMPLDPRSPYSASKAAGDQLCNAYRHTFELPVMVTRCSNNYGPYQFPEKMIPLMINNARHDKPLPVYGDGLNVRDWLYVEDHCSAIWAVLTRGQLGRVYNIGGESERTNLQVVRAILGHLGKPESLISFVKDRPGHDRRYAMDITRISTELGWRPSVDFERGLGRTIEWYLSQQKWLDHVVSGAYQSYYEGMYGGR